MPIAYGAIDNHAHRQILSGALQLADAVRPTLGPRGSRVLMESEREGVLCDDGVTIAKAFSVPDREQQLGASLVRQAAEYAVAKTGDGTTTSILLTAAILSEGMSEIADGADPLELKRGLDRALTVVTARLREQSRPADVQMLQQVARISGHHDVTIAEVVTRVLRRVGRDGLILLREAAQEETTVEVVKGLRIAAGYRSPYLLKNRRSGRTTLRKVFVLVTEETIDRSAVDALLALIAPSGQPLLIVASDIDDDAMEQLVAHAAGDSASVLVVNPPAAGVSQRAILEDIAIRTGGRLVAPKLGVRLAHLELSQLGVAGRVVIDADTTTIFQGAGARQAIHRRAAEIRGQIRTAASELIRGDLAQRLAGLGSGTAVIRVGGVCRADIKSRVEAFDDALNATRAAMAEGVLPGGGLALLRTAPAVDRAAENTTRDERRGMLVLKRALDTPMRQIAVNAGADADEVVKRARSANGTVGFDARSAGFADLFEAGVIDPTKVVCVSIEAAVSVAGMLLLSRSILGSPASSDVHVTLPPVMAPAPAAVPAAVAAAPIPEAAPVAPETPIDVPAVVSELLDLPAVAASSAASETQWLDDGLDDLDTRFNSDKPDDAAALAVSARNFGWMRSR